MKDASGTGAVLEARDIVVRFGGVTALDGIDVSVPPASLVGLVGPNGAGKSTMFSVCSGFHRPHRGRVFLNGQDVTGASAQARARMGMARTFQHPELFYGLTVRQHLVLAYRVRTERARLWRDMFDGGGFRKPKTGENERVDKLLEMLSLQDAANTLVDTLPLGTTRLVEVGRALAAAPRVVLLDEPLSGLDPDEAGRLADSLTRTVQEEGTSLLLVEHDVATVLSICATVFVLNFGKLTAAGTPDFIRNDAAVKAAYLGDEPVNGQPHTRAGSE